MRKCNQVTPHGSTRETNVQNKPRARRVFFPVATDHMVSASVLACMRIDVLRKALRHASQWLRNVIWRTWHGIPRCAKVRWMFVYAKKGQNGVASKSTAVGKPTCETGWRMPGWWANCQKLWSDSGMCTKRNGESTC